MTAAIKSSLTNLNTALKNLEKSASEMQDNQKREAKNKPASVDLFTAQTTQAATDVDTKALASRLDSAIAKVEKLLHEGDEAHG